MCNNKKPAAPPFIVDAMLGKLTRYLRMLGLDAIYTRGDRPVEEARKTARLLLTRNRKHFERCSLLKIKSMLIKSNYPIEQLAEVLAGMEKLKIDVKINPFSRCIECNNLLYPVSNKEEVRGWVPPFVFKTQRNFKRCPKCGRFYWEGTHKKYMEKMLEHIRSRVKYPPNCCNKMEPG